jgi:hypothetical protein
VQGVISTENYHVDLLHLRTATGTQILDLRRDMYNFAVSNDGTDARDLEANPASNWHPSRAGSRMDAQYVCQGMNVEALQYAVLRVKKPLQGYKGGEIESLLNGQSQMRTALEDADKLLEASQHPWLRDAPKRVHAVRASPATMLHGRLYRLQPKSLDRVVSFLCGSSAARVGAPAQVVDTLAEIHQVLQKHPCPVKDLELLCAKIGPQVDWFIKHKLPAFQTTPRWYMHVLTCHIVDMAKAQAQRGLSPAITSSSFVEAAHKITKSILLSLPGGGNPRASELAKNPLVMCFKKVAGVLTSKRPQALQDLANGKKRKRDGSL